MPDGSVRLLRPNEAWRVCEAITSVYGTTYELPWVYDPAEVELRMERGLLVSAVAELDGDLACHCALTFRHHDDLVGHTGQAVTLPAARGHHLFTSVKRYLVEHGRHRGLVGMYSEATAAHPYSQRANLDLGATETGFMLGYIAESVDNSLKGTRSHRQSAALFYLRLNEAIGRTKRPAKLRHPLPGRPVYAPAVHREMIRRIIARGRLPGRLASPPTRHRSSRRSTLHTVVETLANRATLTVTEPGTDLSAAVEAARRRLFGRGYDAVYVDLPLEHPATSAIEPDLTGSGFFFAGVFPNCHGQGDVMRVQAVRSGVVSVSDVEVASDHGRELLDYVVADLHRTDHSLAW